ncbi:MAG: heavy metal translocating P-type ATPase [Anaerovoracaceae bacterium]
MNKMQKTKLIRVILASGLFAVSVFAPLNQQITMGLAIGAFVIAGYSAFGEAAKTLIKGHFLDENFLMSIAGVGAMILGQYSEGCAVMLFYLVGEFFETYAVDNSRKSIGELMDIRPDIANVITDDGTKEMDPYDVEVGSILLVKPGERIPIDGVIIEGSGSIDTKALTGEPLAMDAVKGTHVISGCINLNGLLKIETTKEFSQSTVAKVLDLVENATTKKAATEKFITKFAKYYTPIVVAIAAVIGIAVPLIMGYEFADWIYKALLFLVISCPCALVISVPLSFFGGIGSASKNGILVKGSNYLEAITKLETIIFDKTGTITSGKFAVEDVESFNCPPEQLLTLAAYVEYYSTHPLAEAIITSYNYGIASEGSVPSIDESAIANFQEIPGKGSTATINGTMIFAGNAKLMELCNVTELPEVDDATLVHVATGKEYLGYIALRDQIKEDSAQALEALETLGIEDTVMLTGDRKSVAESVGKKLRIGTVFSQLLPNQKLELTETILEDKTPNKNVAFVGDGINDAPTLARVDIGIAMGGLGSEAAIDAADIVIMDDKLSKIPKLIKIAKKTIRISKENIVFALGIKFAILALGLFGIATMWMAIFADVGVSIIAILNSMRTLRTK